MSASEVVNLDAMIAREDFGKTDVEAPSFETINVIAPRDLEAKGLLGLSLRKPDFQRETNHWSPEQVVSLLECFVGGDLIPSVILWQSPTFVFVIDGGHRLSVLRAWVSDDYGDGPQSQSFFGGFNIHKSQRRAADKVRNLVANRVGSWQQFQNRAQQADLSPAERVKLNAVSTRGLNIQWVKGNADKAEGSFFRINTKGTDLDEIEELLLRNRHKAIPIAARAIIRAGKGHKYWSSFAGPTTKQIEDAASELHALLFDPEVDSPIKTLELPLGGPKVRDALDLLIQFALASARDQSGKPKQVADTEDDATGAKTIEVLKKMRKVAAWISGNRDGSLGLHPAIYFYGPTGRHSAAMFMGTVSQIAKRVRNNDKDWFKRFTKSRARLETALVHHKDLIATLLQKHLSTKRVERYESLLEGLVEHLDKDPSVDELTMVRLANLEGKVVVGGDSVKSHAFSADTKSEVFIQKALAAALRCEICGGYIDAAKSISYDHVKRKRDGGDGSKGNLALTHPFCNQAIKG